jgi:hypothetical protein
MRTNRIEKGDRIANTKDNIVKPLYQILENLYELKEGEMAIRCGFPRTETELQNLRRAIDNTKNAADIRLLEGKLYAESAEKELDRLIKALGTVLAQMQGVIQYNALVEKLRKLEMDAREASDVLKRHADVIENWLFEPTPKKP